ncbi:hypothetical protein HYALB_00011919 [Hymenoscyphus albidus]|uniref:Uncharacterized protein n=1 Tax=Hymenoscyphus albidus TaxID=595503 RepID=A0A9N9LQP5_9HELO|nr:hypothetical protein HYALB_00011919 [Hymenoscyphus albidus]
MNEILGRHEETLRKRWAKKTKKHRTTIFAKAWPNMATMHRPDFEALRREGSKIRSEGSRREYRDWYMWPYINVEDLVRGKTLLLMLNSRGRNPPRMFAHADFAATRIGHISEAVMPPFLNNHTMYLLGESVETYGRVVSWDDDNEACNAMITQIAHPPGEGLMILEIQQRILRFLVDCCRAILHDWNSDTLLAAPIKPEPPSLADAAEYSLITSVATDAPYRLPACVDFRRLGLIAAARRSSAEDHIHSMREDPGYFADFLKEWGEHRQEQLLDTNGHQHPVLSQSVFWDRVIGNVVTDAYWSLPHVPGSTVIRVQKYIAQSSTPGVSSMSSWVSQVFSDLGLVAAVRHELDIYQPWAAALEQEGLPYQDEVMTELTRRLSPTQQIIPAIKGATFGTLGGPVAGRFSHPSDKRRTQDNVTQMRKAETNLDSLWNAVDTYVQRRIGQSPQQVVSHLFEHTHQLERTPEWVAPIQSKHTATPVSALQESFSKLELQSSAPETSFTPSVLKVKPKTRGTTNTPLAEANLTKEGDPLDTNTEAKPLFRVKNRVLKVFKTLFFNPSQTHFLGEVS